MCKVTQMHCMPIKINLINGGYAHNPSVLKKRGEHKFNLTICASSRKCGALSNAWGQTNVWFHLLSTHTTAEVTVKNCNAKCYKTYDTTCISVHISDVFSVQRSKPRTMWNSRLSLIKTKSTLPNRWCHSDETLWD